MVLARNGEPEAVLSKDEIEFWRSLGGTFVRFVGDVEDVEGFYTELMDEYGCDVIVKRPDFYIFGAAASISGLPALIADLRGQLSAG
jgi:hypothetical protein